MGSQRIIVLLTDFGLRDSYVGIIKGVIAQIEPQARIIDLTHQVPPQDIWAARFLLLSAVNYFPKGTIFVAVVDPGVGSQRRSIALAWEDYYLIAPDNGVLSGLLDRAPGQEARELTHRDYWRVAQPGFTFHGRDIFAPVAAHLARGVPFAQLGDRIGQDSLVRLSLPELQFTAKGIIGSIQYFDHFGNGITTIAKSHLVGSQIEGKTWVCRVGESVIVSGKTYSEALVGEAIALIGSEGWVEIAVNRGSAQERFDLKIGDRIELIWQ